MSVFMRKGSPFFYAEFQIHGHRFLRSTGKTTEREARAEERSLKAKAREQIEAEASSKAGKCLTLSQAFGKYWLEQAPSLSVTWRSEVKRYCAHILNLVDGRMLISEVGDFEVDAFVQAHIAAGGGKYALNRAIAVWRRVHNLCHKRWKQDCQVIEWSEFKNREAERVRSLSIQEARHLIACTPRLADAIEWSLLTGCRRAETFSLTWEGINFQEARAVVTAKGGKPHTLWLNPDALALLARLPRHGRYVFEKTGWRKRWDAGVKASGLTDFRWHDLRHCHCTWLRQAGVPVEVVQRSAGHANIQTTLRYAHVFDPELVDALHKLPSLNIGGEGKVVSIRKGRK